MPSPAAHRESATWPRWFALHPLERRRLETCNESVWVPKLNIHGAAHIFLAGISHPFTAHIEMSLARDVGGRKCGDGFRGIPTGVSWALARDDPLASIAVNVKTAIEIFMDLRCPFCIFGKSIRRAPNIFGTGGCFGNYLDETMIFGAHPYGRLKRKTYFATGTNAAPAGTHFPFSFTNIRNTFASSRDSNLPACVPLL